jgi:hypothetical protein
VYRLRRCNLLPNVNQRDFLLFFFCFRTALLLRAADFTSRVAGARTISSVQSVFPGDCFRGPWLVPAGRPRALAFQAPPNPQPPTVSAHRCNAFALLGALGQSLNAERSFRQKAPKDPTARGVARSIRDQQPSCCQGLPFL